MTWGDWLHRVTGGGGTSPQSDMRVLPQEPGRIEYYNLLFCLCGHNRGVSDILTSLDLSDL